LPRCSSSRAARSGRRPASSCRARRTSCPSCTSGAPRGEHFVGFYLNARNQLLARSLVSVGSLSASIVHPREVFEPAIVRGAAGVIVAHNHPSGDPSPRPRTSR
jgi:DNA repair protein RadC